MFLPIIDLWTGLMFLEECEIVNHSFNDFDIRVIEAIPRRASRQLTAC